MITSGEDGEAIHPVWIKADGPTAAPAQSRTRPTSAVAPFDEAQAKARQ